MPTLLRGHPGPESTQRDGWAAGRLRLEPAELPHQPPSTSAPRKAAKSGTTEGGGLGQAGPAGCLLPSPKLTAPGRPQTCLFSL